MPTSASRDDDDGELVAEARRVGVERILTIGLGEESNAEAVRTAREHEGVFAAVGRHPNSAGGFDDAAADAIEELAADPMVRAIGETGLDFYRDRASEEDQVRAFEAQIDDRPADEAAARHPHARQQRPGRGARGRRRLRAADGRGRGRRRDPALLLGHGRAGRAGGRRTAGTSRSPATSPTRTRASCARRRRSSPTIGSWSRPTARSSRRSPFAASPTGRPT